MMMKNKMIELVASAGFVLATFAGVQSASAQTCYSPDDVESDQRWSCGLIRARLQTGLIEASVSTTVRSLVGIPHEIHIQLDCAHGTFAENGEAFSINDNFDSVGCPNGETVQHVTAWVVVNPSGGGLGEGEGGDEGAGDEGGDEAGDDEGAGDEDGGDESGDDEGGE